MGAYAVRVQARRIGRANDGAHRRAGDRHRTNAQFVQRFEGDDVRYPRAPPLPSATATDGRCPPARLASALISARSSKATARQPMSFLQKPPDQSIRSTAAYARRRASVIICRPRAVTARTRPPSATMTSPSFRVPACSTETPGNFRPLDPKDLGASKRSPG